MSTIEEKREPQPIIEIKDLVISYSTPKGELRAVDGVNLTVGKGEAIGIVGESGCGKTTLALSLIGMSSPGRITNGSLNVDSTDILALKGESLRRYRWEKVSMVFQSAMNALDPVRTVESQIVETILQHEKTTKELAKSRVRDLLNTVKIDPARAESYPHELSGGMRQRVVIAMALALSPSILIADEPTTALDVVVQADVLRTLKGLQQQFGLTILIISHDISIMWEMSDRLVVMYAGKIVEEGPTKNVVSNPQHPYTEALLNSVPVVGSSKMNIEGIPGSPPNLISPPIGCRFATRCPHAFHKCTVYEPPLLESMGSNSACWLREGESQSRKAT